MSSISKSQKLYEEENDKQCEDRISHLPSNLISHILSLLPTKYAVATSVLSTRWKQFWTFITSLDFDDQLLQHVEKSTSNSVRTSLTNFVYRVLLLRRESCLHRFRLKCHQNGVSHVNVWVAASLVCGVKELDLSIRIKKGRNRVLPRDVFACRTMVVLKLGMGFVMNVPTSVRMQSLKILHLCRVKFIDDDSIYRLICGCPVLDELSVYACVGKDVQVIHIFAPVLTKLLLNSLTYDDGYSTSESGNSPYQIVLDTPALMYLELDDYVYRVKGYLVKNLSHLIKANINIGGDFTASLVPDEILDKAVTDLFMGISRVQCLTLDTAFVWGLHNCNYQLPMFHSLASLKIGWDLEAEWWELLLRFLENSPRLATLVLVDVCENNKYTCWNPPPNVPVCLVSHLQVIEILIFQGDEEVLKMLEYFLKNGEVLEKVIIHIRSSDLKGKMEVMKKLLEIPRSSKICQIKCVD